MGFNQNLQSLLRHTLRLGSLEDLTADQRRTLWPPASPLEERHIKNCKVVESREKVLTLLPTGSKCAELGIWKGDFSAMILDVIKPVELHLIDIEQSSIEIVRKRFHSEIDNKKVFTYLGDSASVLASMPDRYFDWVYVDADHSYPAVHNDLKITHQKIKSDGLIALNDYVFFGPSDFAKYGVMEAVNEFCIEMNYEWVYLALQGRGYFDVVIRQLVS